MLKAIAFLIGLVGATMATPPTLDAQGEPDSLRDRASADARVAADKAPVMHYFFGNALAGAPLGFGASHYLEGSQKQELLNPLVLGVGTVVTLGFISRKDAKIPPEVTNNPLFADSVYAAEFRREYQFRVKQRRRDASVGGAILGSLLGFFLLSVGY